MTASTGAPHPVDEDDWYWDDADISTAPFVQQPAYGRGLWRRPISFVPAVPTDPTPPTSTAPTSLGEYIAAQYRIICNVPPPKPSPYPLCEICKTPISEPTEDEHYLSFAHQIALPRRPMPPNIDRTRMGLKYLEKHGFDIDAGVGLGANGQGMLYPIKPKEKRDKLGLGIDKKEVDKRAKEGKTEVKVKTMDAGRVRKMAAEEKKKHEKLQKMFYGNDEVEKYLGLLKD